mmetsp:Transcript_36558/g.71893  ORF Transcript_36558/g.71893 Transcript_36558/m.71893 type:complete len:122 (-) Transcript_36558:2287-2652(-)
MREEKHSFMLVRIGAMLGAMRHMEDMDIEQDRKESEARGRSRGKERKNRSSLSLSIYLHQACSHDRSVQLQSLQAKFLTASRQPDDGVQNVCVRALICLERKRQLNLRLTSKRADSKLQSC